MVEFVDNERIDELSETIVLKYLKQINQTEDSIFCIDVEGLARDYFGFDIKYESIAEDDYNKVAFSSNGVTPLKVKRNGKTQDVVFPPDTIVIDKYYKKQIYSSSRRFIIGHELGHKILSKITAGHSEGNYRVIFDEERTYTFEELKAQMTWPEKQANSMSAALMLPMFLLKNALQRIFGRDKIIVYGENQMLPDESEKYNIMANDLGVAPCTLFIELRKKRLIEYHDMDEYLSAIGLGGVYENV